MDREMKLKAWHFLQDNRLAALATISANENVPQASLVYYYTNENLQIYISTAKNSRKLANITKNNKVALVVGQEMEPIVLQLEGVAEIIEDVEKINELTKCYLEVANTNAKVANWPPVMRLSVSQGYVFVQITVTYFKYSDFSGTDSSIIEGTFADLLQ